MDGSWQVVQSSTRRSDCVQFISGMYKRFTCTYCTFAIFSFEKRHFSISFICGVEAAKEFAVKPGVSPVKVRVSVEDESYVTHTASVLGVTRCRSLLSTGRQSASRQSRHSSHGARRMSTYDFGRFDCRTFYITLRAPYPVSYTHLTLPTKRIV